MKFISAEIENFSSYERLKFQFDNQGLSLISGPTGSGKSSLCDIIPWILFGKTAKNGTVDEVIKWNSTNPTTGSLTLNLDGETIIVTRKRGNKDNDLYFTTDTIVRGKDIPDTQKLLNDKLKLNVESYLAGSYLHEFSQVASFFITTAKIRRQITEQLVDLSLAKTLNKNITNYVKEIAEEIKDLSEEHSNKCYANSKLVDSKSLLLDKQEQWNFNHKNAINSAIYDYNNFEDKKSKDIEKLLVEFNKTKLEIEEEIIDLKETLKDPNSFKIDIYEIESKMQDLGSNTCAECGAIKDSSKRLLLTKKLYEIKTKQSKNEQIQIEINKLEQLLAKHMSASGYSLKSIEREKLKENTFKQQLEQLNLQINPYDSLLEDNTFNLNLLKDEIDKIEAQIDYYKEEQTDSELLIATVNEFRGLSVKNSIIQIETMTNKLLNDHFDAELRVNFDVKEADKVEVVIFKNDNVCSYTQLSKGQRQILKLCFGTSVMKYMNNNIKSNVLFFDEALDGLDDNMKAKAFTLFNVLELDYDSIFVVEHNEALKSMFPKRYEVMLNRGNSEIQEA